MKQGSHDVPSTTAIVAEFRSHLEVFYASLNLAPPYDSVEKALAHLRRTLNALGVDQHAQLIADAGVRWKYFTASFADSGLAHKHRGIIAGLIRAGRTQLPEQYQPWLDLFGTGPKRKATMNPGPP